MQPRIDDSFSIDRAGLSKERFKQLVQTHGRLVLNVALRVLGDATLAQDVHQEVFLAIWRRWERFDAGTINWSSYLYRTTVRKAIELARRDRKSSAQPLTCEPPGSNLSADGNLRVTELQAKLTQRIAKLPGRQAEIFVLSRLQGLSHLEISEVLNISSESVRVHLHRAMKRLAYELREFLY